MECAVREFKGGVCWGGVLLRRICARNQKEGTVIIGEFSLKNR